ncbi:uncharacterized protein V1516DRAFT_670485 [Lipomyces oligophaga]|uniref:uncharacterized protein n=1 Tax=Lipomyces oligophaga TaxID=45792 RepID=UPI0034CFFD73
MRYPLQKLEYVAQNDSLYICQGELIYRFEASTGELLHQSRSSSKAEEPSTKKVKADPSDLDLNAFRTLKCSPNGKHIVTTTDEQKELIMFDSEELTVTFSRKLPKRPSAIFIAGDNSTVLVGDKFGDVYSFPLNLNVVHSDVIKNSIDTISTDPILGHVSMLVDVIMTPDYLGKKYIITSDRDEHIRISCYPQAYIIERFCFGHEQFVSSLTIPSWAPTTLLSAGGDDFIAKWNWTTGKLVEKIDLKRIRNSASNDLEYEGSAELAISGIWQVSEFHIILAFDENTNRLLVFKIEDITVYLGSYNCDLVDLTMTGSEGRGWMSLENSTEQLKKFQIFPDGKIQLSSDKISKKISSQCLVEVENLERMAGLHNIKLLRKHAEH